MDLNKKKQWSRRLFIPDSSISINLNVKLEIAGSAKKKLIKQIPGFTSGF